MATLGIPVGSMDIFIKKEIKEKYKMEFPNKDMSDYFKEWSTEAGIKTVNRGDRFSTYYVYTESKSIFHRLLERIGCRNIKHERRIMVVVSNSPGRLVGKAGVLVNKYKEAFEKEFHIDKLIIHDAKQPFMTQQM